MTNDDIAVKSMDCDDLPAIMDLNDLAEILDVGYRRALELGHTKDFPALRIGRCWRVNRDGLHCWHDRQTAQNVDDVRSRQQTTPFYH